MQRIKSTDDNGKESTHSFPLSTYSAPGDLRQDRGPAAESPAEAKSAEMGVAKCVCCCRRIGSRGDVEPLVALAVRLRALGAEVRGCASPDFAECLAEVGVPLAPVGQPVRPLVHGATPPSGGRAPARGRVDRRTIRRRCRAGHSYRTMTDNRVLHDLDAESYNALFGRSPMDNVRDHPRRPAGPPPR